jgi:DNA-binding transcriptional LysR family regulator
MTSLEEELGIILFERKGRNIRLTKYGKIFLEHVDKILNEVKITQNRMKQLSGNQGYVDIAYVFPLASHYIPHLVRQFLSQEKNKDIKFNFHQLHTETMIEGLKNDKYDIAFCSYVENEPDIQFIPIINQEMVVITPKNHPLTQKSSITLKDLDSYTLIGYDKFSGLGKFTSHVRDSYNLRLTTHYECPDEHSISALVAENFGIALVADVDDIHRNDLTILHLEDTPLHHTVYLAYLKNRYLIPAAQNFIQFVRKHGSNL